MDWQTSEDTVPSAPVTEADARLLLGRPPATGAWQDGDPVGDRSFATFGAFRTEGGRDLPGIRIAYETWGTPDPDRGNAVLVLHALTGDERYAAFADPEATMADAIATSTDDVEPASLDHLSLLLGAKPPKA